jgi:hypothetical protein
MSVNCILKEWAHRQHVTGTEFPPLNLKTDPAGADINKYSRKA